MKVKAFLKSLLPAIAMLVIQLGAAAIVSVVCTLIFMMQNQALVADQEALTVGATQFYLDNISYALIATHAVNILIMALWIRKYNRLVPDVPAKHVVNVKNIIMIVLAGLGVQFTCVSALSGLELLKPGILDNYTELMQQAGIGELTIPSVIAAVILAPIGEELCFRGITSKILRNAKFPVWAILVIPAVLFGVEHMNIVQGSYAAVMGLLLGYVAYKYKSVLLSILLHLVINGSAYVLEFITYDFGSDWANVGAYFAIGILLFVIAYVAFDRRNEFVVLEEEAEVVVEESQEVA